MKNRGESKSKAKEKWNQQYLYMETYSTRENVKFVGLLEKQVDNMNGGDEDHKGAQEQIAVLVENWKLQFRVSVFFPFLCLLYSSLFFIPR